MYKYQRKHKPNHTKQNTPPKSTKKWPIFTYTGKATRIVAEIKKKKRMCEHLSKTQIW
jgi:hypothetical protein